MKLVRLFARTSPRHGEQGANAADSEPHLPVDGKRGAKRFPLKFAQSRGM